MADRNENSEDGVMANITEAQQIFNSKELKDAVLLVGQAMSDLTRVAEEMAKESSIEAEALQKRTRKLIYPLMLGLVVLLAIASVNFSIIREGRNASFLIADCTTPPGEIVEIPGDCYKRNADRQELITQEVMRRIDESIKRNADQIQCNLSPASCKPGFTPER